MMTREEASRHLHNDWYIENGHLCVYENARDLFLEAVGMGIKALRPVSREQVGRMRGEWRSIHGLSEYYCSRCGEEFEIRAYDKEKYRFCPHCMAPMTDKAVEMAVKRLEALYEEN